MVYEVKSLDKEGINNICLKFDDLLDRLGYGSLSKSLHYIIRELLYNAVKANMKRVFIADNKFTRQEDIVKEFRNALSSQADVLIEKLSQSDMLTKVEFVDMKAGGLLVRVQNNADMRSEEIEFVDSIINKPVDDNWEYTLDEEEGHREGAGLGLRSVMRILKQSGLGEDSLSYSSGNGKTVFELMVKKSLS